MAPQKTLRRTIEANGIALHNGRDATVVLQPAPVDTGIVFVPAEHNGSAQPVRAHVENVVDSMLATTLGDDSWRVATVEHLLAALVAEGVDNVRVVVGGGEIPALDGSAAPWVDMLRKAGLSAQDAPRKVIKVLQPVQVQDGPRWARISPADHLEISATIEFGHPSVGRQHVAVRLVNGTFGDEVAWARTFGFESDVAAMRSAGLAQGGSLDNAIVYGDDGVLNPGGLRGHDELARHKVLDMVGDLALAGLPVVGRFEANRPGHALSRELVTELLATPDAWKVVADTD